VSIEETLCYPDLACEDGPVVLSVECGDDADNHQLKWKRNCAEGSDRHKEKEEDPLFVKLFRVLLSQV